MVFSTVSTDIFLLRGNKGELATSITKWLETFLTLCCWKKIIQNYRKEILNLYIRK